MIPPSPPASSSTGHGNDGGWGSLDDLERKMAAYRKLVSQGASQAQIDEAAEQVAAAIRSLSGDTPPTYHDQPTIQPTIQPTPANVNPDSGGPDKANPIERVGRGMLQIVAAPIAAAGMGLYACGMVLEGGAELLKGLGSLGKIAMVGARGKRR